MIYRFVIVSPEARSFRRDIRIGSESTFGDLRSALYEDIGYSPLEPSLIHLTDHSWSRRMTIYEVEPPHSRSDEDVYLMESTRLSELLSSERERLMLTFDIERSRAFYIELREMTSGSIAGVFEISRSEGEPPLQTLPVEEEKKETKPKKITAEVPSGEQSKTRKKLNEEATPDEYGSEAFDSSEIDPEGFGTSDESGEFDNEILTEDFSL
ncbi:MAG: hypothetical protein SPI16_02535 [Porphyromonas sp.]|uniref:hypothetical protein n=1 Tax=Porphyromonas sp. TaxID=1924944 RepID=UPI002A918C28|nr:hypothetical protein [Porphyromonas sp.]MDD7468534.1 hypothetical protein [Bacteroidales bacterium]MDY6101908.1 hypothetical protein [Porphyromonas sp.]